MANVAERSHLTFSGTSAVSIEQAITEIARDNSFVDGWHADWMAYYDRTNVPPGDFLRDLLDTGKNHSM